MPHFDFDIKTQEIINRNYSIKPDTNWKNWLKLNSSEEFIEYCLENSGLLQTSEIFEKIKNTHTNSRELSVELEEFLTTKSFSKPPIMCHTSGTTNSNPSALKWFYLSTPLIKRLWAPGMKAIFESSGLDANSSAVIFVPSRMHFDGVNNHNGTKYISLYSSEFSQRLVLAMFKPKSYIFYPYRKVFDLEIMASILQLDDVSVVSAPAATILKWADLSRLKSGIEKNLHSLETYHDKKALKLRKLIENKGIDKAARLIQDELSEKISPAILIFSISSLNDSKWELIRTFMKWEKGKERFTNLYVGSEIGPFASSIPLNGFEVSRANKMYVFPLTLPVIKYKNERKLITETDEITGNLLISRLHNSIPQINIDIGDVVSVKNDANIPMIGGNISRGEFTLKYNIKVNDKIHTPPNSIIKAGDFFSFENFDIESSRNILNFLKKKCSFSSDSLLLIKENKKNWNLIVPAKGGKCNSSKKVKEILINWDAEKSLKTGIIEKYINVEVLDGEVVNFLEPRETIVEKVRNGRYPKGILKKWPLYVVESQEK
ncbi:MAG: hypothetical protein EU541_04070 [Promethearchaeota archaeon]|nr:MAG: hypothetical protein EU541_04070 [Candidatus Lokiarchaeota archaeon]